MPDSDGKVAQIEGVALVLLLAGKRERGTSRSGAGNVVGGDGQRLACRQDGFFLKGVTGKAELYLGVGQPGFLL